MLSGAGIKHVRSNQVSVADEAHCTVCCQHGFVLSLQLGLQLCRLYTLALTLIWRKCCHLRAQVRFGAHTGAAPIFLGGVKLILGLAFGSSLFALLQAFPMPLLGAMLIFAGVHLACIEIQRCICSS